MKKNSLVLALCMPFCTQSTVLWNGVMGAGTANALDEDVQINGDTWLPNEIVTIQALNQNVTVSLLNGPHHVYSSDDGQTTLVLEVQYPYTIEIIADHNLIFAGVEDNLTLPLLIEERALGSSNSLIRWTIADDCKLYFGDPEDENRGGALLQIICNDEFLIPRHIFKVNEHHDDRWQIRFNHNSGIFLVQETLISPAPLTQEVLIDASNANHHVQKINFKDGSGWFFEFIAD
ncbi:MAG TPA: hypothetical protein VL201_00180 [Patescibacteria group bacterium]|jgi:hypothetical protein|nr:hypothetical protein [Patescibacteria group bacterium]